MLVALRHLHQAGGAAKGGLHLAGTGKGSIGIVLGAEHQGLGIIWQLYLAGAIVGDGLTRIRLVGAGVEAVGQQQGAGPLEGGIFRVQRLPAIGLAVVGAVDGAEEGHLQQR